MNHHHQSITDCLLYLLCLLCLLSSAHKVRGASGDHEDDEAKEHWSSNYSLLMDASDGVKRMSSEQILELLWQLHKNMPAERGDELEQIDVVLDIFLVEGKQKCSRSYIEQLKRLSTDKYTPATSGTHVRKYLAHYVEQQLKFCGSLLPKLLDNVLAGGALDEQDGRYMELLLESVAAVSKEQPPDQDASLRGADLDKATLKRASFVFIEKKNGPVAESVKEPNREMKFKIEFESSIVRHCKRIYQALEAPVRMLDGLGGYEHILSRLRSDTGAAGLRWIRAGSICRKIILNKETIVEELYEEFIEGSIGKQQRSSKPTKIRSKLLKCIKKKGSKGGCS